MMEELEELTVKALTQLTDTRHLATTHLHHSYCIEHINLEPMYTVFSVTHSLPMEVKPLQLSSSLLIA